MATLRAIEAILNALSLIMAG